MAIDNINSTMEIKNNSNLNPYGSQRKAAYFMKETTKNMTAPIPIKKRNTLIQLLKHKKSVSEVIKKYR